MTINKIVVCLTGMQACQAYQSCPVCTHCWSPPLSRGCVCDGMRSFLPPDAPGREQRVEYNGNVYEYKDKCTRPKPKYRDSAFVKSVLTIATRENPVLGHKFAPLIASWPGFDWRRVLCVPEMMHDVKCFTERLMRLLVGTVPRTSYKWSKDERHRAQCKRLGIFEEVWPENGGALPWRLTNDQRDLLHARMGRVLWPHYVEPLYFDGDSCWQKPGRMWKARRKYRLLLFILPTQLRDQLPALRDALMLFVWSLRRLLGQKCSYEFATGTLGILPGSSFLVKKLLPTIHRELVKGLSLFEGATPIDDLPPISHHFIHYGDFTPTHGILSILWMMGFERYIKYLKEHVRNSKYPEMNLAHTTTQTDTANYFVLLEEDKYDLPSQLYHK